MNTAGQAAAIARWAESRTPAVSDGSRPLSRIERSQIAVASKRTGVTVAQLASEFDRSEAEIAEVLRTCVDSRDVARHMLKAQAADLTDRMLAEADAGIALDILERVDVVKSKKGDSGNGNITIVMNGFALHGMPTPPETVEAEAVTVPGDRS